MSATAHAVSIVAMWSLMFSNRKHIQFLEARICALEKSLAASQAYSQELVERLLQKQGVPTVAKPIPTETINELIKTADVFADIEDADEIEDTRKEPLDAFAS